VSALYAGTVTHKRLRPRTHLLRYRIFMLLLDLDTAPALARRLRLFGFDGPGLVSFHQRDHGDGTRHGLRAWVDRYLAEAGLTTGGKLLVLAMPRVLGHAFNPLTVFYCHAPDGALQAILYEVRNTFGQRHAYLLRTHGETGPVAQQCAKTFHVSPFLPMALRYRFRVLPPGRQIGVFISVADEIGTVLAAAFAGARQEITDAALLRQVLRLPLMGLKVLAGIHWEAAILLLKGLKLQPPPPPPVSAVTIGP
jgi:DUF1365 family protein